MTWSVTWRPRYCPQALRTRLRREYVWRSCFKPSLQVPRSLRQAVWQGKMSPRLWVSWSAHGPGLKRAFLSLNAVTRLKQRHKESAGLCTFPIAWRCLWWRSCCRPVEISEDLNLEPLCWQHLSTDSRSIRSSCDEERSPVPAVELMMQHPVLHWCCFRRMSESRSNLY